MNRMLERWNDVNLEARAGLYLKGIAFMLGRDRLGYRDEFRVILHYFCK